MIFDALDGTVIRKAALQTQALQACLDWMLMDGDNFVLHFNRHLINSKTHWHWLHDICVLSAVLLKLTYISEKIEFWSYNIGQLGNIVKVHPHAAMLLLCMVCVVDGLILCVPSCKFPLILVL